LFDTLVDEGFTGTDPTIQRAIRGWKDNRRREIGGVLISLTFTVGAPLNSTEATVRFTALEFPS
jgi:hypothetical protein